MGQRNSHGSVRSRKVKQSFPRIYVDQENDFASIRLADGTEAKSYVRDGFVFLEDKKGRVIEVQVLNLSELAKLRQKAG
jgi:hypothetical protein